MKVRRFSMEWTGVSGLGGTCGKVGGWGKQGDRPLLPKRGYLGCLGLRR